MPWLDVTREFGPIPDEPSQLQTVVKASQYLQAESYRYAAEASRRRFPNCSGYIIWMGHDNLHNTSNNSVVQIDGATKPAYDWLQRAYANLHVSLRHDSICYAPGERFVGRVFVHEDAAAKSGRAEARGSGGAITASLRTLDGRVVESTRRDLADAETSGAVMELDWAVPVCEQALFLVELVWERPGSAVRNRYLLSQQKEHPLAPLLKLPEPELSVRQHADGRVELLNTGKIAAISVRLVSLEPDCAILTCGQNIILLAGESLTNTYQQVSLDSNRRVTARMGVEAFNLACPLVITDRK
jgi:beta-mannosidase